jgi:NAD(P)-dependent dehydrogenase (short-subunit alcohol dehydrogenase family)
MSNLNIDLCLTTLEELLQNTTALAELPKEKRAALMKAAGLLSRPQKEEKKRRQKEASALLRARIHQADREARAKTGIREARKAPIFQAPLQITASLEPTPDTQAVVAPAAPSESAALPLALHSARNCYVCKAEYRQLHFFYDSMCQSCGDLNYQKRFQRADLSGQVALITGARLKIGYHCALMMLQAGATVIVTTRFPVDAALRFSKESDFAVWQNRLHVYGLDLRHTPSVEIFTRLIEQKFPRLDILINNAAQTVRRPPGFYAHLMEQEGRSFEELPANVGPILKGFEDCKQSLFLFEQKNLAPHLLNKEAVTDLSLTKSLTWQNSTLGLGLRASAQLSQIPYAYDQAVLSEDIFPVGALDADLQQVDLRETNSWRYKLSDVPTPELLEVQLVNAIAPFVLCSRLAPLMRRHKTGQKHIVNVTAMEGKFYRFKKEDRHPHTNMAKAALNMLTHTSAGDLAKDGIYMNAVDTGWVTDEDPAALAQKKQQIHDFQPPLDIVDGAARVCDPFFAGLLTGQHWSGKFLKDYFPIDW